MEFIEGGWTWLIGTSKWHYILDHRSLCGKWFLLGNPELEQGNDNSPDNCKQCVKKLLKMKEKLNANN